MNKKISILLKVLKDLDLEKFATPLADVYDFGTETGKYRYKAELTGKKSKDYFEYSKKIKDDFAVYYMPSSVLNLLGSSKYYLFDTPEDIANGIKAEVGNAHWWNHENNVNNVVSYLKNSKKYKYNIIVNSSKEYGDSYDPTWFIHDIIGHTFSILSKENYGENTTITDSIFGRKESIDLFNLFAINNEESYLILSKIFNQLNVAFDKEMFSKISYDYSFYRNLIEGNLFNIYARLDHMILKIHDDVASRNIYDFLKKIDAEIHTGYILNSGIMDKVSVSDILPSIIVSYISDKNHTISMLTEYISNKDLFYSKDEFYNKIIQDFNSEKQNFLYNIWQNEHQISRLLEHLEIKDDNLFDSDKFVELLRDELGEHFSDIINSQKFKQMILGTFVLKNEPDKIMEPLLDRFKRVDAALERVSDKYIVCNMTDF